MVLVLVLADLLLIRVSILLWLVVVTPMLLMIPVIQVQNSIPHLSVLVVNANSPVAGHLRMGLNLVLVAHVMRVLVVPRRRWKLVIVCTCSTYLVRDIDK